MLSPSGQCQDWAGICWIDLGMWGDKLHTAGVLYCKSVVEKSKFCYCETCVTERIHIVNAKLGPGLWKGSCRGIGSWKLELSQSFGEFASQVGKPMGVVCVKSRAGHSRANSGITCLQLFGGR